MTTSLIRRKVLVSLSAAGLQAHAFAQIYPTLEIKMYVPLSAGSSVDTLARAFTPEYGRVLKQSVLVENRPGAEGVICSELTKKAAPNGYTLMLAYPGHALNVSLYPNLPYDTLKDFTPIGIVASNVNVLVVLPNSPFKTVPDLIAFLKSKPGQLNFGNAGGTSGGSGDLFNLMAGVKAMAVTYKGAAEAQIDLLGGRLDYMFTALSTATPLVKAGKLRAIAVTGSKRHPTVPDLPTVSEFVPSFETTGWYGIAGPAGIPKPIVETLNSALNTTLQNTEVKARLASLGFDPEPPNSPADFESLIKSEIKKWAQVLKPRV